MAVQRRELDDGSRTRNPSPAEGVGDLFASLFAVPPMMLGDRAPASHFERGALLVLTAESFGDASLVLSDQDAFDFFEWRMFLRLGVV